MKMIREHLLHLTRKSASRGQTLVILLLILVVTLTVGLSVVTRTVTNVREAATTDRSTRAFAAAEAGIESVLRADVSTLSSPPPLTIGNATANITITPAGGSSGLPYYQPEKAVTKDDVLQLNLAGATATSLQIEWGLTDSSAGEHDTSCPTPPNAKDAALEITLLDVANSGANASDYTVRRFAYLPNDCTYTGYASGFAAATDDTGTPGSPFANIINSGTITITSNTKLARIRPLFHDTTIRITPKGGGAQIPLQSYIIRSEGVAGDTKRVVQVEKTVGGLPSIFDYVLFNGSSTTQLTHS